WYRPKAREAVDSHRQQGHKLVLLTSSTRYMSRFISEELNLDHALFTDFVVHHGVLTGQPVEPLCYGEGTLCYAQTYAASVGAHLKECIFYTDSIADLPVLEHVGTPMVIDPDPALKRVAKAQGWAICDWGTPDHTAMGST